MQSEESRISELKEKDYSRFFSYLNEHLLGNGKNGTPLFQPVPRDSYGFPQENEKNFVDGLATPVGQPKWKRAWIALGSDEEILAHADLRAHPQPYTSHRALLGMGVHVSARRAGLGLQLIEFVTGWGRSTGVIDIIDLSVLSNNKPAIGLYEKAGFDKVCEIADMFRIDGNSEAHILMSKCIR